MTGQASGEPAGRDSNVPASGPVARSTARLKRWARSLKVEVVALGLAIRDPRTPWYAKAAALVVVAYALSPIDLIPDMIPVLGFVDDAILLPGAIWLTLRLVPKPVMAECRARAAGGEAGLSAAFRRGGLLLIGGLWLAAAAWAAWWILA